jgi:hypothetical protein
MQATPSRAIAGLVAVDERQQIIDLYRTGTKVAEICHVTGRCRSSVYKVVNDAGVAHRNAAPGEALRTTCVICGDLVRYVTPAQRTRGLGRFCSAECMGEAKRLAPRNADDDLLCTRCGESKPASEFYPHATTARGYQYWCKDCCALDRRQRAGVPQDPKLTRKYALRAAYGITPEEYDAMYERQAGRCAICGDFKERWQPGTGITRVGHTSS